MGWRSGVVASDGDPLDRPETEDGAEEGGYIQVLTVAPCMWQQGEDRYLHVHRDGY